MNPATLTGKQRRHLRALGHHLRPLVQVGKEGVTPSLVEALKVAIVDHELVKVKLGENAEGELRFIKALPRDLFMKTLGKCLWVGGATLHKQT